IMVGVLFLAPMLSMLPTPVLSAIVFCALTTVVEWGLARELRTNERGEYLIFLGSCLGVLFFGIIPGVIIGVLLSFLAMLRQTADPPRTFIGTREDRHGYFSQDRYEDARPIPHVIMYRFSATLSFANVGVFCNDLEEAITPDTRLVIIDAGGIANIDFTAISRLDRFARKVEATGARFYFANLIPSVADELKAKGLERLMEKPGRGRDIEDVLVEFGIDPYPGVPADDFRAMKAQLHCSMLKDNDACDYVVRRHWKSGAPGAQPPEPGAPAQAMAGAGSGSDASLGTVPSRRERPHSGPSE
ncbi:MAG: STAS domain-containing protein, partial [Coriobacteriales bacterium]